jgi:hypothetical protein
MNAHSDYRNGRITPIPGRTLVEPVYNDCFKAVG